MKGCINFIIEKMKEVVSNFELEGKLLAQGDQIDDRYEIIIKNNVALKRKITIIGTKITCPHCESEFYRHDV